ncbi:MAG: hypothetical protein RL701_3868 [Pseudomonadota bacterium]
MASPLMAADLTAWSGRHARHSMCSLPLYMKSPSPKPRRDSMTLALDELCKRGADACYAYGNVIIVCSMGIPSPLARRMRRRIPASPRASAISALVSSVMPGVPGARQRLLVRNLRVNGLVDSRYR